jgi:hypothetical protein
MNINIEKELKDNQTVLLLVGSLDYNETVLEIAKILAKKNVCYVTLNKTFDSLKELFKKNKINVNNIVFIDAITKTIKEVPDQTKGCYYINSPGALTELSLAVSKFLGHDYEYVIFDSLTNLLIYEKKEPVEKFVSMLINKIKSSKTRAVFYALNANEQSLLIQETGMFVDKVINLK